MNDYFLFTSCNICGRFISSETQIQKPKKIIDYININKGLKK